MNAFVPTLALGVSRATPAGAVCTRASRFVGRALGSGLGRAPAAAPLRPAMQMDDEEPGMDMDRGMDEPQELEEAKLFVGNLSWGSTDESLGDAFSEFGEVIDSKVVVDRFTGKSRGFGFITFAEAGSAEAALENMNGAEVDGRPIRLDRANKRVGGSRPRRNFY